MGFVSHGLIGTVAKNPTGLLPMMANQKPQGLIPTLLGDKEQKRKVAAMDGSDKDQELSPLKLY